MVDTADLRMTFRLSKNLADMLYLLLEQKHVTMDEMMTVSVAPKVAVVRLRKALGDKGITVNSMHGFGYWLDEETKERVIRMATPSVVETQGRPDGTHRG